MDKRNLTMLMDLYELTMSNGIFNSELRDTETYFDMFFRRIPDNGGFAIMAGLEQLIEYFNNLHFDEDDISYLRGLNLFSDEFIDYLKDFKFSCDVWAVPEGTVIFPREPIVTVKGPAMQAFMVETMVLLTINHQSLIATKANRIVRAADGRPVMEFGARRAQGADAAYYGARAAIIGGCTGTSDVKTAKDFDVAASGTMAHSWVQLFDDEYTAFKTYAEKYPDSCLLLVDTYNVIKSGIPNAIKVFDEVLKPLGKRPKGIRIDSGDITYISKKARKMLDAAGYEDCKICVSNSLDEHLIRDMIYQGAKVDSYGVGERLITASSEAVFGGVYKLAAVEKNGEITPKIKISENAGKITLPGVKIPWRLYDNQTGKAIADVIALGDEKIDDSKPYEIFDPEHTWKRKTVTDFTAKKLQVKVMDRGTQVYNSPNVKEISEYRKDQVDSLWDEVTRFENPHTYYVDLSQKLWDLRFELLNKHSKKEEKI
ncbi:MAG: nicotinate phosphoribosyltransferase [Clostridia bacterium]|nr:nicotinate phosphoribosyltransferase [Clostridia bacterium]MEE1185696.1 nicotinate phosphoribosyltransferase [Acutalibacteraceae bacterium]